MDPLARNEICVILDLPMSFRELLFSFHSGCCIAHIAYAACVYINVLYYFGYYVKLNDFLSFLLRLFHLDKKKMNFVCLFYILQLC